MPITPRNPEAVFRQVDDLLQVKRPLDAEKILLQALSVFPDQARLQGLLAQTHFDLGRDDQALKTIQHAITLDPNDEWFYRLACIILLWSREIRADKALEMAMEALRLSPESDEGLRCLFEAQMALNDKNAARHTADRLIRAAPDSTDAYYCRGRLAYFDKQRLWAKKHFLRALRQSPDNAYVHYYLAWTWRDLEKYTKALEAAQCALRLSPCNTLFLEALKTIGKEAAAQKYGHQTLNAYNLPVRFRSGIHKYYGPHISRARCLFPDFALKFKKEETLQIPFSRTMRSCEFEVSGGDQRLSFTWQQGFDPSNRTCAFPWNDKSYVMELEHSESFGTLEEDVLVIRPKATPAEASGEWICFTDREWSEAELIEAFQGFSVTSERTGAGLCFERDGSQVTLQNLRPVRGGQRHSLEETNLLHGVETLLEGRACSRFTGVFQGPQLAEEILSHLSKTSTWVIIDVSHYGSDRSVKLRRVGELGRLSKSYAVEHWDAELPEIPGAGEIWSLLLDKSLQPDEWMSWVQSMGGKIVENYRGVVKISVRDHWVNMKLEERPRDNRRAARAFEKWTGHPLGASIEWHFNSLPLAVKMVQALHTQWPCVILRGPWPQELRRPDQLQWSYDPLKEITKLQESETLALEENLP